MTWYKAGKISVNNGSKVVTGIGTDFISNVQSGFGLVGPDFSVYEIASIQNVSQITLATAYRGATLANQDYAIWQTQGLVPDLLAAATTLLNTFGEFRDAYEDGELVGKGLAIKDVLNDASDLPANPVEGDAYFIGTRIYVFTGAGGWKFQDVAGVVARGAWNPQTVYAVNDLATYGGSAFRCIVAGASEAAPDESTNWEMFVQRGPIGPAGVTPRGDWDTATAYAVNDTVTYQGSQWRRLIAGVSIETPDVDAVNWGLFLQKGRDGQGAVNSVNSKNPDGTGNVQLTKSDIGLSNVDNTADANKPVSAAQRTAIDAAMIGPPGITGLTGASDATSPTTKFTLSADSVTTRDATGKTKTYFGIGPVTVDISVANSLGGRDQAGAFAAGAEPNFFFAPNGSGGLGLVASLAGVNVGPTGYTEWAIAANLKLNGSGQMAPGIVAANEFFYSTLQIAATSVSTPFPVSVSYSAFVPANAMMVRVHSNTTITSGAAAGIASGSIGLTTSNGVDGVIVTAPVANSNGSGSVNSTLPQTPSRTYQIGSTSASGTIIAFGQSLYISGYTMRNGAR